MFFETNGSDNENTSSADDEGDLISKFKTFQGLADPAAQISENTNLTCFVRGTRIHLVTGETRIEEIKVGDQVITRDNGFQFVRWVGSVKRFAVGKKAPIVFKRCSVGNDEDLMVSPNNRIPAHDCQFGMWYGKNEALIREKYLINKSKVKSEEFKENEYFHILFDQNEFIHSHGVWTENSCNGGAIMDKVGEGAGDEAIRFQRRNVVCSRNDLGPQPRSSSMHSNV